MSDNRPTSARRVALDWTQAAAVAAMLMHVEKLLPDDSSLIQQWKRREAGEVAASDFYQPIIITMYFPTKAGAASRADTAPGHAVQPVTALGRFRGSLAGRVQQRSTAANHVRTSSCGACRRR